MSAIVATFSELLALPVGVKLTVAAAMLGAGVALLYLGARGRRVGAEPRCRKCDYNLTGLAGQVCPECSTPLAPRSVIHGTRRPRWGVTALGGLFAVAAITTGFTVAYDQLQGGGVYRYYPFSWVLRGALAGNLDAQDEIERRIIADMLTDAHVATFADIALARQTAQTSTAQTGTAQTGTAQTGTAQTSTAQPATVQTQRWIDWLDALFLARRLDSARRQRYFEQFLHYQLDARPVIRQGDPLVLAMRSVSRGPTETVQPYFRELRCLSLTVNGEPLDCPPGVMQYHVGRAGDQWLTVHEYRLPALDPGTYLVACTVEERLMRQSDSFRAQMGPYVARTLDLTTRVRVDAADAPDPVHLLQLPAHQAAMQSAVVFEWITQVVRAEGQPCHQIVCANVSAGSPPVPGAFEAFVRTRDNEFALGPVLVGTDLHTGCLDTYQPCIPEATVDIILRPSADLARGTPDLYAIWGGELVYSQIVVRNCGATPEPD